MPLIPPMIDAECADACSAEWGDFDPPPRLVDLHLIITMIMIIVREWVLIIRGGIVVDVGAFTDMIYREP